MKDQELHTLTSHSLQASPFGNQIIKILSAAIKAVDPAHCVRNILKYQRNQLMIDRQRFDLSSISRILVISIGKASFPMAEAAEDILGDRIAGGIVLAKYLPANNSLDPSRYEMMVGGHPVPNNHSLRSSKAILEFLKDTQSDDLVLFLVSGGGSALLTYPVEKVSLADLQSLTKTLLSCGATINEINTLRKHLSQVKGGQLARWAAPANAITLILSDVIGDPLDVIASGPTVPDPTTYQQAADILEKYGVVPQISPAILTHLRHGVVGDLAETPKEHDPIFDQVFNRVIGNNYMAATAAVSEAKKQGFNTTILSTFVQGEAREVGKFLAAIARQESKTGEPLPRPVCIVVGGETTVTLQGNGLGGRNQELALAAVEPLSGLEGTFLVTLATDGDDGPTDAAGAVVTGQTLERASRQGLDPGRFLVRNDAYNFFEPLGDLLKPGPTGTNVCDLNFIIIL